MQGKLLRKRGFFVRTEFADQSFDHFQAVFSMPNGDVGPVPIAGTDDDPADPQYQDGDADQNDQEDEAEDHQGDRAASVGLPPDLGLLFDLILQPSFLVIEILVGERRIFFFIKRSGLFRHLVSSLSF